MGCPFSKISSVKNLPPKIKEADLGDNLWIGANAKLIQWSVSQGIVTKDYGDIMAGSIKSMVLTIGKNHLFVSDHYGC
jgi:WD40 repeat protein